METASPITLANNMETLVEPKDNVRSQGQSPKKTSEKKRIAYEKAFLIDCFQNPVCKKKPRSLPDNLGITLDAPRVVGNTYPQIMVPAPSSARHLPRSGPAYDRYGAPNFHYYPPRNPSPPSLEFEQRRQYAYDSHGHGNGRDLNSMRGGDASTRILNGRDHALPRHIPHSSQSYESASARTMPRGGGHSQERYGTSNFQCYPPLNNSSPSSFEFDHRRQYNNFFDNHGHSRDINSMRADGGSRLNERDRHPPRNTQRGSQSYESGPPRNMSRGGGHAQERYSFQYSSPRPSSPFEFDHRRQYSNFFDGQGDCRDLNSTAGSGNTRNVSASPPGQAWDVPTVDMDQIMRNYMPENTTTQQSRFTGLFMNNSLNSEQIDSRGQTENMPSKKNGMPRESTTASSQQEIIKSMGDSLRNILLIGGDPNQSSTQTQIQLPLERHEEKSSQPQHVNHDNHDQIAFQRIMDELVFKGTSMIHGQRETRP